MIVRDLWAYQLSLVKLPSKPNTTTADGVVGSKETKEDEVEDNKSDDNKSDQEDDSKSDSSSEPGVDKDLLEEISERSSSSSDDDIGGQPSKHDGTRTDRRRPLRIIDTLVCLVVGLWMIRYPVVNVDIER